VVECCNLKNSPETGISVGADSDYRELGWVGLGWLVDDGQDFS